MLRFAISSRAASAPSPTSRSVSTISPSQPRPARRGFTLIEVLIAMIVIGILAAMAVPAIKDYIAGANDTTMKDDLEKVMADGHLYFMQNNTYVGYPSTGRVTLSPNNTLSVVSATATALSLKVSNSASSRNCVHSTDENPALTCSGN